MGRVTTAMLSAVLLTGCATTVETLPSKYTLGASDHAVVVGRIETPVWRYDSVGLRSFTATHETTANVYHAECDERGGGSDFYVALPPGRYRPVAAGRMTAQPAATIPITDTRASRSLRMDMSPPALRQYVPGRICL